MSQVQEDNSREEGRLTVRGDAGFVIAIIIAIIIGFVLGCMSGMKVAESVAVQKGVAEWVASESGRPEFKWIVPKGD